MTVELTFENIYVVGQNLRIQHAGKKFSRERDRERQREREGGREGERERESE